MKKEQICYTIITFDFKYILFRKFPFINHKILKSINFKILWFNDIIKITGDILPLINRVKFLFKKGEILLRINGKISSKGKISLLINKKQQNFDFLYWRFKFLWEYLQKLSKNLRFNFFKSRLHDKVRHILLLQPKQYFKNVLKAKFKAKAKKVIFLTFRLKKHLTLLLDNGMELIKLKNEFTEWWFQCKNSFFNFVKSKWFNKLNMIFFLNIFFKQNWKNIKYRRLIRKMLQNLGIRKVANKFLQKIFLQIFFSNRSRFFLRNWFEIIIFCLNFGWIPRVLEKTKIIKKKLMFNNKFVKSVSACEHKLFKLYAHKQKHSLVKAFFINLRRFNRKALKKKMCLANSKYKMNQVSILFYYLDQIDDEFIRLFVKKQILVLWNSYLRIYFPLDDVMSSRKFIKIFNIFIKKFNIFKDLEIDLRVEKKKKFLKSKLFSKLRKSPNIINVYKIRSVSNAQSVEPLNSIEVEKRILKKKYIKKLVKVCLVTNKELRRKWYFNAIFWKFFFKPFYFWLIFSRNFFFYYYLKMLFNLWLRSF